MSGISSITFHCGLLRNLEQPYGQQLLVILLILSQVGYRDYMPTSTCVGFLICFFNRPLALIKVVVINLVTK